MVKIVDVAKTAGVSTASVSRVISGLPGVSDETRARFAESESKPKKGAGYSD